MPNIRETRTATGRVVINEWQLSEVSGAFDVPLHPDTWDAHDKLDPAVRASLITKNPYWYGGLQSLDEARALLEDGWKEGSERLESLCADLNPPTAQSRRRKPMWRSEGDDLSVDRALVGAWDTAWRTSQRVWCDGPTTIDLYTIYGGSAALSSEQIFWNGAAAVVLANRLEAAGYRVRIVGCFLHGEGNTLVRSDVVIKEASDPLRIDGVASVLCHAGVYRTYLFRTWGVMPFALTSGFGPAIYRFSPTVIEQLRAAGEWPEGSIVIDQAYSRDECIARINEVMRRVQPDV